MEYMLVLQWPASGGTEDYDALIELEDRIAEAMGTEVLVDGHDMGSGEMNLFLLTDEPEGTFRGLRESGLLGSRLETSLRAAYREAAGSDYQTLWPAGLTTFRVK